MEQKKIDVFDKFHFTNQSIRLFYLFLVTDIAFMLLHLIHHYTGLITNSAFSLETDRGFAEVFQYIKEYWIAIILVFLAVKTRMFLYGSWSLLFFYLLLDDAGKIHERLGTVFTKQLAIPGMFNLRGQDFGELLVISIVVVVFLTLITITYRFGDATARKVSKHLIMMMFALAFCGVILDLFHIAASSPGLDPILMLLEDGGELVIMSFIAGYILSLFELFHAQRSNLKSITQSYPLEVVGRK
ncbi:hypothetical protein NIES2119_12495 [[Phormidium ambiguum] IAM M-71]|uniref:Uncharacterized protein n=1 Tax=[Phormidium ambiguum] IAM M-71 TaxID=454136 RepID=A0A1U7IK56_9CYAN|nr:hypothetical protein [Phormidium ambiguum]OKH37524.1 hypothetical protein NIES2119_12495 [Phormidium ambiguum IAM M-71]